MQVSQGVDEVEVKYGLDVWDTTNMMSGNLDKLNYISPSGQTGTISMIKNYFCLEHEWLSLIHI